MGAGVDPSRSSATPRNPQNQNFVNDADMSRDPGEYPVIVWDADYYASSQVMISFPTPTGYSRGELVPGSYGGVLPSIVRDHNADVWLTWWEERRATWWTHTYTHATATATKLLVDGHGRKRTVVWSLDEPAPESWWAVLRSRLEGPFEVVARVQAGDGLMINWTDDSPPAGYLRYKVRRECLDTRYAWESAAVSVPVVGPGRDAVPGSCPRAGYSAAARAVSWWIWPWAQPSSCSTTCKGAGCSRGSSWWERRGTTRSIWTSATCRRRPGCTSHAYATRRDTSQ